MIDAIMGDNGTRFIVAALAVAAGLVLLILVLWLMRNRSSSTFIRGGKNRQPRLAVLDAAAVDTRRRLVLVRRDDVEHLIMIGGPTDIVIESRIGTQASAFEPAREPPETATQTVREGQTAQRQQPAIQAERKETAAGALRAGPAPQNRPEPEQKLEPKAEPSTEHRTEAKPVSAMGQILYSDPELDENPPQAQVLPERHAAGMQSGTSAVAAGREVRPQPATRSAEQMAVAAAQRQPVLNNPAAAASNLEQSAADPSVSPTLDAEDILDAARSRVLPRQVSALPETAAGSSKTADGGPSARTEPVAAATELSDFESFLDAEISGDLQRLAPHDPRTAQFKPQVKSQGERVDPTLGPSDASATRKEPTLEQEMARMLGEMSVNRKN